MAFDFDTVIDRRNTNSLKFDFIEERGHPAGVMPLWLADMDFQAPPAVIETLHKVAEHGIFGYTDPKADYFDAARDWFVERHGFEPKREWFLIMPGIVFALASCINAFTKPGEGVLIQPPVYLPFTLMVKQNNRQLVENPLCYKNGSYSIDFEDLELKLADPNVKLMILCNPHNPIGKVWDKASLMRIGELCVKHGVVVISDEIHCDFIFPGHKHYVFSALSEEIAQNCVVCTAPSKTFNIAGMQMSSIFVPNPQLYKKLSDVVSATGYGHPTICGLAAAKAAYSNGAAWLDELLVYLKANADYVRSFVCERLPEVHVVEPDGTFLLWVDFSALALNEEELKSFLLNKAGLWLDEGTKFGRGGECFMRLNIGCPRSILEEALVKLEAAIRSR